MLTVKTHVGPAGDKGLGLFADETIPAGAVWWKEAPEFDRIVGKQEAEQYPQLVRDFLFTYASLTVDGNWYVCMDNAKFVNHSDNPNTAPQSGIGPAPGDWIATRTIRVGEKITSDYRETCMTCKSGLRFENRE